MISEKKFDYVYFFWLNIENSITLSSGSTCWGDSVFCSIVLMFEFEDDTLFIPIGWFEFVLNTTFSNLFIWTGECALNGETFPDVRPVPVKILTKIQIEKTTIRSK